jgi:arginase family enzyme
MKSRDRAMLTWDQYLSKPQGKIGVMGFPFDENSSFQQGSADAPPIIRSALYSGSANLWSENGVDLGAEGIFVDAGDDDTTDNQDVFTVIEREVSRLLESDLVPLCLGGDHSVTSPIIKAMAQKYKKLERFAF